MTNSVYPGRTLRNDHGGPLCAATYGILNGIDEGSASVLIDMLRSTETIDRHTRGALADALERDLEERKDTVRLRLVRPDGGGNTWQKDMERCFELQNIADAVNALRAAGKTRQQAIGELIDRKVAGRTKIEEALAFSKRSTFRVAKHSV